MVELSERARRNKTKRHPLIHAPIQREECALDIRIERYSNQRVQLSRQVNRLIGEYGESAELLWEGR